MTAIALPRQRYSAWRDKLRSIQLGLGARGGMGLGLGESEPAAASAWPLDWTVAGVPEPSILFQLKGAADWAQASQNLGSLGSANDAVAQAGAVVPAIGANGAIFTGYDSETDKGVGFGVGSILPGYSAGTFYYLVQDIDGVSSPYQRMGYVATPRLYLSHFLAVARCIWASGNYYIESGAFDPVSLGMTRTRGWRDGILKTSGLTGWVSTYTGIGVGGNWQNTTGAFAVAYVNNNWFVCNMPLFAFWHTIELDDSQMAAWDAAVKERLEIA